jgi:hypothetical protein
MTYEEFKVKLRECGLNVNRFAKVVRKNPDTVSQWRKTQRGVPGWVPSWIALWSAATPETKKLISGEPASRAKS